MEDNSVYPYMVNASPISQAGVYDEPINSFFRNVDTRSAITLHLSGVEN